MRKLVLLLKKIYLLLLFIIFEVVAISFYANSTEFTTAKIIGVSNSIFGWGHKMVSQVGDYFHLAKENRLLTDEIASLRATAGRYTSIADTANVSIGDYPYVFTSATVVNNSVNRRRNFITIDKGTKDGIRPDMAIASAEGYIVGYVVDCSDNFAGCISVLNTDFRSSGVLSSNQSYGSLSWDGANTEYVTLSDIPKYAQIKVGDTVLTTSFSAIFPPGMIVGTVESYAITESMLYELKIKLAARMASLNHVLVVGYTDAEERMELESRINELTRTTR